METTKEFIARKKKQFEDFKIKKKVILMKDVGRQGNHGFECEAQTFFPASNLKEKKVFVFERLRKVSRSGKHAYESSHRGLGELEYRIGYFIVGQIGRAKNRWIWGQFCPIIPVKDLERLMKKAKKEKTIL